MSLHASDDVTLNFGDVCSICKTKRPKSEGGMWRCSNCAVIVKKLTPEVAAWILMLVQAFVDKHESDHAPGLPGLE